MMNNIDWNYLDRLTEAKLSQTMGAVGEAAEALMTCALAARFIFRQAPTITRQHVIQVMNDINSNNEIHAYIAKDKNQRVTDRIVVAVDITKRGFDFFKSDGFISGPQRNVMDSAINFVNKRETIQKAYRLYYENNKSNVIKIHADGKEGQGTTKMDLYILVDRKVIEQRISLKTGNGKNTDGTSFNNRDWKDNHFYEKIVKKIEDVTAVKLQNDYREVYNGKVGSEPTPESLYEAVRLLFDAAAKEINEYLKGDDDRLEAEYIVKFSRSVKRAIVGDDLMDTHNENQLEYVRLFGVGNFESYRFEGLTDAMSNFDLDVRTGSGSPTLEVFDRKSKQKLFNLRFKRKQKYPNKPTGYRYNLDLEMGSLPKHFVVETR